MNFDMTRPHLDPNDASGAAPAPDAAAAAPAAPVTPATPAPAPAAPAPPLFDDRQIQAQLAALRTEEFLRGVENTTKALEQRLAQLETMRTPAVAPSQDVADDVDPEIANNPAFKKLRAVEEQNAKLLAGFEQLVKAQEAERQAREQASQQARRQSIASQARSDVTNWLSKEVLTADPEIANNPLAKIILTQQAEHWLASEFDPDADLNTQYLELRRTMSQTYNKVKGLAATAPSSPREAAIVTDTAARNNVASPGSPPVGNPATATSPYPDVRKPAGMREALRRAAQQRGITSINGVPIV